MTLVPRGGIATAERLETRLHAFSARHGLTALRLALGFVFLLFGVLKFFPDLSPAQGIAEDTTHKLFLGIFPDRVNLTVVAVLEVTAGLCLLSGRYVRVAALLLLVEMAGILSPLVLVPGMLFGGPHHLPNLLGQYILKDVVLLAAVLVLLGTQRGGRLVPGPAAAALGTAGGDGAATEAGRAPRRPLRVSAAAISGPRRRAGTRPGLLGPAPRRDRRLVRARR
jgi:uncharacterized membrane protein YphA (DoxX/SURF4 family)